MSDLPYPLYAPGLYDVSDLKLYFNHLLTIQSHAQLLDTVTESSLYLCCYAANALGIIGSSAAQRVLCQGGMMVTCGQV